MGISDCVDEAARSLSAMGGIIYNAMLEKAANSTEFERQITEEIHN